MEPQTLIYEFDDVRVDVKNAQVFKSGKRVGLEPKAFRVLVFLLERPGRLVEKEEILSAIWTGTFVTENALTRAVALLRKVLGDGRGDAKYIETVPTRGYRMIAPVTAHNGTEGVSRHQGDLSAAKAQETSGPAVSPTVPDSSSGAASSRSARSLLLSRWAGIVVLVFAGIAVAFYLSRRSAPRPFDDAPDFRTVQLTNSTGLDINPTFSPDGNTLAYSSNENGSFEIYVKQLLRGGRPIRLTNDGARNFQPAWSPDGTTIAYTSQAKRGIWLVPALGGVARQLTTFGASPAWSPDGSQIAFQSGGIRDLAAAANISVMGSTLWTVSLRDGTARELTKREAPPGAHNTPCWSPDGKTIAFVADDFATPSSLWLLSLDSRQVSHVTTAGGLFNPVFAPDGKKMYVSADFDVWEGTLSKSGGTDGVARRKLFSSPPEISRYLAVSSDGRRLAFSRVKTTSNIYSLPMKGGNPSAPPEPIIRDTRIRKTVPVISPDSRRILFDVASFDRNGGIWIADMDGSNSNPAASSCSHPNWLPGGEDFACVSFHVSNDSDCKSGGKCFATDVWKVHVATGGRERILQLKDIGSFFNFSRDGKMLAFMAAKDGVNNVWIAPLDGGAPHQVTFDSEMMGFPSWSPDGKYLAVEQSRGDDTSIWLVKPGETPIQITTAPGQNWPHGWSPDGDKIVFVASRDGVWNVWLVSRRDRSEKQLTSYSGMNHYVRYPAWSPDGKAIVYEYAETTGNIWMLEKK